MVLVGRNAATAGALVLVGLLAASGGAAHGQDVVDLPGSDRSLDASFDEVFRVGSFEGELWETFGEIQGVAFDANGNLYILDRQANQITVVDRDGAFVRSIGQPGEGPGEFRAAMSFTVLPDGRVVVADLGHRAYQLFDASGEFERMVAMSMDGGSIRLGDIYPHPTEDALITGGSRSVIAMRTGPGGPPAEEGRPIEVVSLEGDVVETTTLARGWQPPRDDRPQTFEGGGVSLRMDQAGPRTFEPALLSGVLPGGAVAFSDSSAYAIKVTGADGGVERVLRRPFSPTPVTERMEEAERERRLAELEEGGGPTMRVMVGSPGGGAAQPISQDAVNEMMRGQIAQMAFYHEVPVLMNLATTWAGTIWAQRRGDSPTEEGAIDVLSPDGEYVGTLDPENTTMPSAFGPDGLAAFVTADDLEVPVVVVRRLDPTVR